MPVLTEINKTETLLSDQVLKILSQNKIVTTLDFLREDINKLVTLTKLNLKNIIAIRTEIFKKYSAPVLNAKTLYLQEQNKIKYLDTGIEKLVYNN